MAKVVPMPAVFAPIRYLLTESASSFERDSCSCQSLTRLSPAPFSGLRSYRPMRPARSSLPACCRQTTAGKNNGVAKPSTWMALPRIRAGVPTGLPCPEAAVSCSIGVCATAYRINGHSQPGTALRDSSRHGRSSGMRKFEGSSRIKALGTRCAHPRQTLPRKRPAGTTPAAGDTGKIGSRRSRKPPAQLHGLLKTAPCSCC